MIIGYVVVGALLALALAGSGAAKLAKNKTIVEGMAKIDVPQRIFPFLAACEFAGAVGLIIGFWWEPLGIAAAIGVMLYFIGAIIAHLRKSDFKGVPNAAVLLVVAVVELLLRLHAG